MTTENYKDVVDIPRQLGLALRKNMEKEWIQCGGDMKDFPEPGPFYLSVPGFPTLVIGSKKKVEEK